MPKLSQRLVLLLATLLLAAQVRLCAQQIDPVALPAKDSHQGLLIAVKPDITADSSKAAFGKHTPYDVGLLGLQVYFKNDSDQAIRIDLHTVRLFIGAPGEHMQKLEPLPPDAVADLVLMLPEKDPTATRRTPLPRATVKSKGKDWNELDATLRGASMTSDLLPAHATTRGYFFFDVSNHFDWLSNARLDIPDLTFTADNAALFFFQIDLASATTPAGKR